MEINRDLPWNHVGLAPTERLLRKIEALLDVDTRMGTLTYRRDASKYCPQCRPYQPVKSLYVRDPDTGERYEFGVKELVWAYAHRRFPTGIGLRNATRQAQRYAADNLLQLEAPRLAPRYGWKYAVGRLPALVKVYDYDAETALVAILPHNFVLMPEEEYHPHRRRIKMRLMRQLSQSNLKLHSYWRVPMNQVGRVTWELLFVQHHHPSYQQPFPQYAEDLDLSLEQRIKGADEVYTWSTRKHTTRKDLGSYARQRSQDVAQEEVPLTPAVGGRLAELRQVVAARNASEVRRYVDQVLFPSQARQEFERAMAREICAGHLVD